MSNNKLRDLFFPPPSEEIVRFQELLKLMHSHRGECFTCKHHTLPPSDTPGYVTDYGSCEIGLAHFPGKVCHLDDIFCECYEYDDEMEQYYLNEIRKMEAIKDENGGQTKI